MENNTNSTINYSVPDSAHLALVGPGFGAYIIVLFSFLVATTTLIVITIAALCVARSVAKLVRVFLINLLVAGLVNTLVYMCFALLGLILNFAYSPPPDLWFCRVLVFSFLVGFTLRIYSLAAFSVAVLLVVKYSKKTSKPLYIILSLTFIWTAAILFSIRPLVPSLYPTILYYDNLTCTIRIEYPYPAEYASVVMEDLFGKLVPLIVSIVVPIVVLCYVRRNTTAKGSSYNKGMARFTLFLLAGNLLNVITYTSVVILSHFEQILAFYFTYSVATVLLLPPPILVNVFLKPVRDRVHSVICYCCRRPHPVYMANNPAHIPLVEKN